MKHCSRHAWSTSEERDFQSDSNPTHHLKWFDIKTAPLLDLVYAGSIARHENLNPFGNSDDETEKSHDQRDHLDSDISNNAGNPFDDI